MRNKFLFLWGLFATVAWADDSTSQSFAIQGTLPALAGGVNVKMIRQCVAQVNQTCQKFPTWEQKNQCMQQVFEANADHCAQTQAIYQKEGMLPYRIQAMPDATQPISSVVVFTLFHIGDGQESFHIIDQAGNLIDLVNDQDPSISTSPQFQQIQKLNPGAGLMQLVSGKPAESPQIIVPQALANKKGESSVMQLVFPQMVKVPPCLACKNVAVAEIAYRFSYPEGKFLGVNWSKTEVASPTADVIDQN